MRVFSQKPGLEPKQCSEHVAVIEKHKRFVEIISIFSSMLRV